MIPRIALLLIYLLCLAEAVRAEPIHGRPSRDLLDRTTVDQMTVDRAGEDLSAAVTVALGSVISVATDTVDSATVHVITAASHSARVGDRILFTSGSLAGQTHSVVATATNTITVGQEMASAPAASDAFEIFRFRFPEVNSDNALTVSMVSSPGAGSLTKDEDAAHVSGDDGVFALAVVNTTDATFAASGDYAPVAVGDNGAVKVDVDVAFQRAQSGGLMKEEDTAAVAGEAVAGIGSLRQDALSSLVGTDNEWTALKSNSVGAVYVTPGTHELAWDTASIAHDGFDGTFDPFLANGSAHRWVVCIAFNDTDGDVALSNSTTAMVPFLSAGTGITLDLGTNGGDVRTAIQIRHINDATRDSVYISCGY